MNGMRYKAGILVFFTALALLGFSSARLFPTAAGPRAGSEPAQSAQTNRRRDTSPATRRARIDYRKFSHRTPQHQRACDSCHKFPSPNWQQVRKADAAFPDITEYPQHASCLDCHRTQFFARERPAPAICSVCHVASSPRNTTRFPFPTLTDAFAAAPKAQGFASAFRIHFPHDKHIEIVGRAAPPRELNKGGVSFVAASFARAKQQAPPPNPDASCAVCHQLYRPQGDDADEYATPPPKTLGDVFWLKKGTFMTAPDSHAGCFTCHSQDNADIKPQPTDCATCHKLWPADGVAPPHADFDPQVAARMSVADRTMLAAWRARISAGTFRHEGGLHREVGCTTCHNVVVMNTLDERTRKVPVLSCGGGGEGCHVTPSAEDGGALNVEFAQRKADAAFRCTKCHLVYAGAAVPASHTAALEAFRQK
jgi:hypothetical protein